MVRFKNRYFVVEIIWDEALKAPSTRPPQDITRALLQKALQVLLPFCWAVLMLASG